MENDGRIPSAVKNSRKAASAKKPRGQTESAIEAFTVQCNKCHKWRIVETEDEFEEFRSKQKEDPFVCEKLPQISCDDPADIEYDSSRTWVRDQPNIPKTPKDFRRIVVVRTDFSRTDVHYVPPVGKGIRSAVEMEAYLQKHPEYKVSVSDFCFTSPKLMNKTRGSTGLDLVPIKDDPSSTSGGTGLDLVPIKDDPPVTICDPIPISWVRATDS